MAGEKTPVTVLQNLGEISYQISQARAAGTPARSIPELYRDYNLVTADLLRLRHEGNFRTVRVRMYRGEEDELLTSVSSPEIELYVPTLIRPDNKRVIRTALNQLGKTVGLRDSRDVFDRLVSPLTGYLPDTKQRYLARTEQELGHVYFLLTLHKRLDPRELEYLLYIGFTLEEKVKRLSAQVPTAPPIPAG